MGMSRWQTAGAVVCLVAGPLGQLAQYLVSPVKEGGSPSEQVTAAAAHAPAMRRRRGPRRPAPPAAAGGAVRRDGGRGHGVAARRGGDGAELRVDARARATCWPQDVVIRAAAAQPDHTTAVAVVSAYEHSAVVTGFTVFYLAGHVIGFILLGIALVRSRAVPGGRGSRCACGRSAEMLGEAAGLTAARGRRIRAARRGVRRLRLGAGPAAGGQRRRARAVSGRTCHRVKAREPERKQ